MAVLEYRPVNVHPEATMNYILNPEKIIPGSNDDVWRVLNYMGNGGPDRVYALGYNCSANPELCEQQFAFHRQRYYDFKNGAGVQGCNGDKSEILALHFFISYDEKDAVTPEIMNEISTRFFEETKLKNFSVLAANHFNTAHYHTHALANQYSAIGKPRKFAMKQKDFDDMRRTLNHICYEYGLSVIDLPKLRMDKEYSHWIDGVIAEGKVRVLDANGNGLKHKDDRKGSYYRWIKAQEEFNAEEEKRLTEKQLQEKKINEKYFYSMNNKYFRSTRNPYEWYAVHYDEVGRRRSTLELICMLTYVICKGELGYAEELGDEMLPTIDPIYARRNYKLEAMVNAIATAREQRIETPAAVGDRIKDTGKQMNELKVEKAKHDSRIASSKALADAISAYLHFRSAVEGVEAPQVQAKEIYDTAYSIMAAHRCTTPEQIDEFLLRYNFSLKKSDDYSNRLDELKKQYRDLKRLEAISNNPTQYIARAYKVSKQAVPGRKLSIVERMQEAAKKQTKTDRDDYRERYHE